jgi:uncharacterized protein YfkK (UPF0435 family)
MAAKLNQIIAVVNGKKNQSQKRLTDIYHKLQKSELFSGISRNYEPVDEDGEQQPPEKKFVQYKVDDAFAEAQGALTELLDAVATQDWANTKARANVVVDGNVLLEDVPVTFLLILEKSLTDIHTFVSKLPTLDPAEKWSFNSDVDCYASETHSTNKTKKVPKAHILYEATKEHPAQVETFTEDVKVGEWHTIKFSGAIPAQKKNQLLARVTKVQEAVKFAREEANALEVAPVKVGEKLFGYLFGNK